METVDKKNTEETKPQASERTTRTESDLSNGRTGKYLSDEQFLKVELALLRLNTVSKDKTIYQWRIKAAEKELEVEQYRLKEATNLVKERVAILRSKIKDLDAQEEKQRKENVALMGSIAKEHGLESERLGYDPESKEIIL